jgi:molybdopterin synthase sulfur carrier subunit
MSVEVRVTAVLQRMTGGAKSVKAEGETVGQVLGDLDRNYPGFLGQVMQEDGRLHRFVNIYLNDEDIRYLDQLDTRVGEGDVVSILPALAGGNAECGMRNGGTAEQPVPYSAFGAFRIRGGAR